MVFGNPFALVPYLYADFVRLTVQPQTQYPAGIAVGNGIGQQIAEHPVQRLHIAHHVQRLIRNIDLHPAAFGAEKFIEGQNIAAAQLTYLHLGQRNVLVT
ncbi:hypothetical protein D3C75_860360 [compost metagenome]